MGNLKKYVIFKNGSMALFSTSLTHSTFLVFGRIESAGFFVILEGKVVTFGYSESLKIKSREDDAGSIQRFLGI